MIHVDQVLRQNLPKVHDNPWLQKPALWLLRGLLHERDIQSFGEHYPHVRGLEFVEQVLDYFQFTYTARDSELDNIPREGRVVIIANHPIGSLDGLALLKLISDVRSDVKVLANDLLQAVEPLNDLLVPVPIFHKRTEREPLKRLYQHLENEGALIVFPAGEVSRLRPAGVRDGHWQTGFLRIAERTQSPLLPIYVKAHNSAWFYGASMLYKPLATALLVQEMFRQQAGHLHFRIGEMIPWSTLRHDPAPLPERVRRIRKHLYRIGADKPGLLPTQRPIARAEQRQLLKREIEACERLGETADGKSIYRYRYQGNSAILREIGRLREIAFRAVGEGTGQRRDLDNFDTWYDQLILWDVDALEIAGAYRLVDTNEVIQQRGKEGLYTHSLFDYSDAMQPYFAEGLELGRSFVQPKYWGMRSLDYLWQGIGALLQANPQYRYLFGAVTMSATLPTLAKDALVQFFGEHFPDSEQLAECRTPYHPTGRPLPPPTTDYAADFAVLKHTLAHQGAAVPTLYKQYADLCEPSGVRFLGFNVDEDFANAIDGLVMVDLARLKSQKAKRYLKR